MRTLTIPRSWAPLVSMKVNVSVAAAPLPRAGFNPVTLRGVAGPPGIFQTPNACQPELFCAMSRAARYMILFPPKLALKVMFRLRVKLLPTPPTEEEAPLMLHWLLARVPADP